ncbi:MAG: gliding motility-associated C-terminal domain-containing protein [Bacteroidota bacterium]
MRALAWLLVLAVLGGNSPEPTSLPLNEEICDNGIDDDGDGLIDCMDSDCFYSGLCTPCSEDRAATAAFQTGYDERNDTLLPAGAVDSSWTWSNTLNGPREFTFAGTCGCDPAGAWVCNPVPDADWIASTSDCLTGGFIYYHYEFELPSGIFGLFQLNLVVYADDFVNQVFMNGVPQNITSSPPNYLAGTGQTFSLNGNFLAGTNTLSIEVGNTGGPGGLLLTADPDFDTDDDGVPDDRDRCWLSPPDLPVNEDGCSYFLTQDTASLCDGGTLNWQGQLITQPGTYEDTLNATLGCDSILRLKVEGAAVLETFVDTQLCQGNAFLIGTQAYNQSGFYVDTLLSSTGCDSIVSLNLEMLPFFDVEVDTAVVVCELALVAGVPILQDTMVVEQLVASTGCDSTVRYQVTAIDKPDNNFDQLPPFCLGESIELTAEILPGVSYLWPDGSTSPSLTVSEGGMVVLQIAAQFCTWADSVEVSPPIDLQISLDYSSNICFGEENGYLRNFRSTIGIAPFVWEINGTRYDSLPTLENLPAGSYDISLTDAIGCMADTSIQIETLPGLLVDFPRELELQLGESAIVPIQTSRDPSEISEVRWTPDSFVSCQNCLEPGLIQPARSLIYQISIRDTFGCETSLSLDLTIRTIERVFLPTAFSPNADGINDFFRVLIGAEVASIQAFQIFSRWGVLAFETNSSTAVSQLSWDGITRTGAPAPEGVYVCVLRYRLLDGRVRVKRGTVSLVR